MPQMDNYFYLPKSHETPMDYVAPPVGELAVDTQHPELNSRNFRHLLNANYEEPKEFLPVYSLLGMSNGLFIVGTNHFSSYVFDGNFIGTEDFDSIVQHDVQKTAFVLPERSTVTGLKFVNDSMFIGATMNCDMSLWDWKPNEEFSPSKCGHVQTTGYVSYIDRFNNDAKLITASKKGFMDVYDFGMAELRSDLHIPYGNSVTGISAHPVSPKLWASCSLDRSCLIWDKSIYSSNRASPILQKYEYQLSTVHWTSQREFLMVGDEIGNVLTLDVRAPNKILQKLRVAKRGICQISFNGSNRFGVVSNDNVVNISEMDSSGELKVTYTHNTAVMNYAMHWDDRDEKTFYVVGEKQFAEKVTLA